MSRTLESVKKDIEYVRTHERSAIAILGFNELYSLFESGKASDKVRYAISQYLKELSGVRKELEEEMKRLGEKKNEP